MDQKLFFNSLLRYMIVINLKLTVTVWAFFFLTYTSYYKWTPLVRLLTINGIFFLLVYPVFLSGFLIKNQIRLEEPYFKKRFSTAFDGIEIEYKQALIYGTVFLVRRFWIVFANIMLNADCPWTNFEENRFFYKIMVFLMI